MTNRQRADDRIAALRGDFRSATSVQAPPPRPKHTKGAAYNAQHTVQITEPGGAPNSLEVHEAVSASDPTPICMVRAREWTSPTGQRIQGVHTAQGPGLVTCGHCWNTQ